MDSCANDEPWKQTILALELASRSRADSGAIGAIGAIDQAGTMRKSGRARAQHATARAASHVPFSGYIRILERLSSTAVSVCWYDATCGHYADQLWKRTLSRHKTFCTLTGRAIKRGDAVYRPSRRGVEPANANHAILACVLEAAEGCNDQSPAGCRFELEH